VAIVKQETCLLILLATTFQLTQRSWVALSGLGTADVANGISPLLSPSFATSLI
jgi:hypothetical protein